MIKYSTFTDKLSTLMIDLSHQCSSTENISSELHTQYVMSAELWDIYTQVFCVPSPSYVEELIFSDRVYSRKDTHFINRIREEMVPRYGEVFQNMTEGFLPKEICEKIFIKS